MLDKELLNQLYRFAISLTNNDDQAYDLLQTCIEKYLKEESYIVHLYCFDPGYLNWFNAIFLKDCFDFRFLFFAIIPTGRFKLI